MKIHTLLVALLFHTLLLNSQTAGTLDQSFGTNGKVITDFNGENDRAFSLAVQTDQKIVVVGRSGTDYALVRYLSDGTLDPSFGNNGKVLTDIEGKTFDNSIAIQANGKILISGQITTSDNVDFILLRYNDDGTLDSSFGTGGKAVVDFEGGDDYGHGLTIQPDGKILVTGNTANSSDNISFGLLRFNTDGSLDQTFGTDGKVIIDFSMDNVNFNTEDAHSVILQEDGKIVLGGLRTIGIGKSDFAIARLLKDGTIDSSFGIDGKFSYNLSSTGDAGFSLAIQSDGKILLSGKADDHFAMLRVNTNGTIDNTFGNQGTVIKNLEGDLETCISILLQADQKIILGGYSRPSSDNTDFVLLRYLPDGTIDNSFGDNGQTITEISGYNDYGYDLAFQQDGKILLAGISNNETDEDFAIVRYFSGPEVGLSPTPFSKFPVLIYPNPVLNEAILEYTLSQKETLNIGLYDESGKLIKSIIQHQAKGMGDHQEIISMNAALASGTYFVILDNGQTKQSVKIIRK